MKLGVNFTAFINNFNVFVLCLQIHVCLLSDVIFINFVKYSPCNRRMLICLIKWAFTSSARGFSNTEKFDKYFVPKAYFIIYL